MAVSDIITQQGDSVWSGDKQVVIGHADPVVITRPVWGGQSPGAAWQENIRVSLVSENAQETS